MCMLGGFAETVAAPDFLTFRLADRLDMAQGAGLILNYHTAYFSLSYPRGPAAGRDGAGARRSRRRGDGDAAGREGPRLTDVRRRLR